LRPNLIFI